MPKDNNGDDLFYIDKKIMALVAGILESAENDLRKAFLEKDKGAIRSLKRWFKSEWGQLLSNNNGDLIIKRIEEEVKSNLPR